MSPETFFSFVHPADQEAIIRHMSDVTKLNKGEVSTIEYQVKSKNKDWLWCSSQGTGNDRRALSSFVIERVPTGHLPLCVLNGYHLIQCLTRRVITMSSKRKEPCFIKAKISKQFQARCLNHIH